MTTEKEIDYRDILSTLEQERDQIQKEMELPYVAWSGSNVSYNIRFAKNLKRLKSVLDSIEAITQLIKDLEECTKERDDAKKRICLWQYEKDLSLSLCSSVPVLYHINDVAKRLYGETWAKKNFLEVK